MRFPVCSFTWRVDNAAHSGDVASLNAILKARSQELYGDRRTSWCYFGNHERLEGLDGVLRLASSTQRKRETALQLWAGNAPDFADEFQFATAVSDDHDAVTRLLEQWEFGISTEPFHASELLLWGVAASTAQWCRSHLSFCNKILERELAQGVWNCFQSYELRAAEKKQNEYWALRPFLEEAVPTGALITDGRTPEQKAKMRRKNMIAANAGVVIGRSTTGQDIVAVNDSPESLTAFEAACVT